MGKVREISKEKDIIRIIGRMPDSVMDKDPEEEEVDILDRFYEVPIGTQDNLKGMLQKAGYKVTRDDAYTIAIIGDRVSEEQLKAIPADCKIIDVYSLAAWLVDNNVAQKVYKFKKNNPSKEPTVVNKARGKNNILLSIVAGLILVGIIIFGGSLLLVLLIFVPGALTIFVRSFLK